MQEPPYHNDNPYTSYGSSSQENASPYGNAGGQNYGNQSQPYSSPSGQNYGNQNQPYGSPSGQNYGSPAGSGYDNQGQNYVNQPYGYGASIAPVSASNGMAIAALIFGIIGVVLCWIPFFGVLLPIVGIILGVIGRRKPVQRGLSLTGLVLGIVGLVIALVITLLFIIGIVAAARSSS